MKSCHKEKAARGQVIRTDTGVDHSSHKVDHNEALMGRKMGGGYKDVSHSLGNAGEVKTYNDVTGGGSKGKKKNDMSY